MIASRVVNPLLTVGVKHCAVLFGVAFSMALAAGGLAQSAPAKNVPEASKPATGTSQTRPQDSVRPTKGRVLTFSGLEWVVKTSANRQVGPGPNFFSDSEENAWVDEDGKLHLRITNRNGQWQCAEVICKRSFGYGRYIFRVDAVKDLSPTVVGGLFTWDNTEPAYAHREIDFEYGFWSDPDAPNFQAVVQPYTKAGRMKRYSVPLDEPMTHSFVWRPTGIEFRSVRGITDGTAKQDVVNTWRFNGPDVPQKGREQTRLNLWCLAGKQPAEGAKPELILSKFEYRKED